MLPKIDTVVGIFAAAFLMAAVFAFRLAVGAALILAILGWAAAGACRRLFAAPRTAGAASAEAVRG